MIFNFCCLAYQIFSKHNIKPCILASSSSFQWEKVELQKFIVAVNILLSILVYQFYIFYSHLNSLQGILTIIYLNINNKNSLVIINFITHYEITTSCCFHSLCKRTKLSLFNRALSFKLCFYGSQMVPFLWGVVDKV